MRIVHYYSRALGAPSGVTAAVRLWSQAARDRGVDAVVVHAQRDADGYVTHVGRGRSTFVPLGLGRVLRPGDVLVLHEGWTLSNIFASEMARRTGVPYVVMPHGVYEPGIMAGLKIRRPRAALEGRLLAGAAAVHVHHDSEVELVRTMAPGAAVMVAPTAMALSDDVWQGGGGYLAWLGRVDVQHKGLDLLVRSVAALPPEERPLVRLHGQDFNGGLQQLVRMIGDLGVADHIRLQGPIWGPDKDAFMRHCDAYLHLSAWECMSIALLEALAAGTPTIMSGSMHISSTVAAARAAVVVDRNERFVAEAFTTVLHDATGYSERARRLVETTYSWDVVMPRYLATMRDIAMAASPSGVGHG